MARDLLPMLDGLECLEWCAFSMIGHGVLVRSWVLSRMEEAYISD